SGQPVRESLPQDALCPPGSADPTCVDPQRVDRKNKVDNIDRYAVLEYRTRLAQQKAGIAARAYIQQFVRGFEPLQVLAPSLTLRGGLAFKADQTTYRVGAAVDGDVELSRQIRVLYGAEAFREWNPNNVTTSLQGDGSQFQLLGPYNLAQVPLLCPRLYDPATMTLVPVA